MKLKPRFRAACFDLDGTLVDTTPLHLAAEADTLSEFGVDPSDPRRPWTFGLGDVKGMELLANTFGLDHGRLLKAYVPRWYTNVASGGALKPGAQQLLRELGKLKVPLALVTSGDAEYATAMLGSCGISSMFRVVVSGDDVQRLKPHPEPYLRAAESLGVASAECIGFEDSPAGLASLQAAGMYSVAVTEMSDGHRAALVIGGLDTIDGKMLSAWFENPIVD